MGQRVPALPAHAADPGADQQPPVRLLADHHPHRPGGCRLADQIAQVGDWKDPAIYSIHRADQLDLRLPDVFPDVVRVQLLAQPGPVPHRLVCGVALHPNAHHSCYSHQQNPIHPKLGQLAAHPDFLDHRRGRRLADGVAVGQHARIRPAPAAVLAVSGHYATGLRAADPVGEDLVHPPVWRMMAMLRNGNWRGTCKVDLCPDYK